MNKITMIGTPPKNITTIKSFLQVDGFTFSFNDKRERNKFIRQTTWNLKYKYLPKHEKSLVIQYISKITGLSHIQAKRLIALAVKGRLYGPKSKKNKTSFKRKYTSEDIRLLALVDNKYNRPNAYALQHILKRMYFMYKDESYVRLKDISHGHIYNLRNTTIYKSITNTYEHTKPSTISQIGIREKPNPLGPGFLRVDSVHGGDRDGKKGIYYINLVDELTQWEVVVCVEGISERYLSKVWQGIFNEFPFRIKQFHSDNGSEFINYIVANILNKLNIRQSKSRPRKHNDNGLVETKNGWVIRKHFNYFFIPSEFAPQVDDFLQKYFNTFLNFHRACAFPTRTILPNGKIKTVYKAEDYKTPYEKLQELDPKGKTLRDGISYKKLDKIQMKYSDFDFASLMHEAYNKLLSKLSKYI